MRCWGHTRRPSWRIDNRKKVGLAVLGTLLFQLTGVARSEEVDFDQVKSGRAALEASMEQVSGRLSIAFTQDKDPEHLRSGYELALAKPDLPKGARGAFERLLSLVAVECCLDEKRTYLFDMPAKRLRAEVEDLRDLESALAEGRLPPGRLSLSNASKTGIHIQDWNHFDGHLFWSQYRSLGGRMSVEVMTRRQDRSIYDPPLDAGLIPATYMEAFDEGTTTVEEVEIGGAPRVKVACTSARGRKIEATLDPEIGYRYRLIEERRPDGRMVRRYTADDYRDMGEGIVYPFLQIQEQYWNAETGKPMEVTRIEVQSAEFGTSLAPTDFNITIPEGTRFWCLLNPKQRQYVFQRDATLTVDALMALAKKIDETTEATGLMNIDAFHRLIGRLETVPPPSPPGGGATPAP